MNGQTESTSLPLTTKIARLVQERGWNQEDFARIAHLNRQTISLILNPEKSVKPRKLRNTTVSACAKALGLPVMDLRTLPLERLLPRMNGQLAPQDDNEKVRRLYEEATQPELRGWLERNPERARQLSNPEIDELLSLQGTGGPLTSFGLERFVQLIERKRKLHQQLDVVLNTEYLDMVEKLVELMYAKVQPYPDRKAV